MVAGGTLKDIRFESALAQVRSVHPTPAILIHWKLHPTAQNLANAQFFIFRGESPTELKQLNAVGIQPNTPYEYVDYAVNLIDNQKVYYYQVKLIEYFQETPVQTFHSDLFTWEGDLDLVAQYIVDEHLFGNEHVYGVPIFIYKMRKEGARCPDCWDVVMKRVTSSSCQTCKGTGFFKGFYPLIPGWAEINPDPKVVNITEWGDRQITQTDLQFTNYPILTPGDIILELKPNIMWKASNNIRFAQKNRTIVLQVARLDAVDRADIEYTLYVNESLRKDMLRRFEERRRKPEF